MEQVTWNKHDILTYRPQEKDKESFNKENKSFIRRHTKIRFVYFANANLGLLRTPITECFEILKHVLSAPTFFHFRFSRKIQKVSVCQQTYFFFLKTIKVNAKIRKLSSAPIHFSQEPFHLNDHDALFEPNSTCKNPLLYPKSGKRKNVFINGKRILKNNLSHFFSNLHTIPLSLLILGLYTPWNSRAFSAIGSLDSLFKSYILVEALINPQSFIDHEWDNPTVSSCGVSPLGTPPNGTSTPAAPPKKIPKAMIKFLDEESSNNSSDPSSIHEDANVIDDEGEFVMNDFTDDSDSDGEITLSDDEY